MTERESLSEYVEKLFERTNPPKKLKPKQRYEDLREAKKRAKRA